MPLKCPHCQIDHHRLAANAQVEKIPDVTPFLCGHCSKYSLLQQGALRKPTEEELAAIKQSPAYRDFLSVAEKIRKNLDN